MRYRVRYLGDVYVEVDENATEATVIRKAGEQLAEAARDFPYPTLWDVQEDVDITPLTEVS